MKQITPATNNPEQLITVAMTPAEYLAFLQQAEARKTPRILRGLSGICELFQCSRAQAFKIAHEPWFQEARVQLGKLIVFDADKAWSLAQTNSQAISTKKPAGQRA